MPSKRLWPHSFGLIGWLKTMLGLQLLWRYMLVVPIRSIQLRPIPRTGTSRLPVLFFSQASFHVGI